MLVLISMFNLLFDFVVLVGPTPWSEVAAGFLINGLMLLYCMPPSTRRTFHIE